MGIPIGGTCPHMCACPDGMKWDSSSRQCLNRCAIRQCGTNEVFKECGTSCEPTCENLSPDICTEECIMDVCQCADGFVRNREGNCVWHTECRACGENEEYQSCGTMCEPSCRDPAPEFCMMGCATDVCQCARGFVRNDEGNCVEKQECALSCGENEEFKECGTMCEATCWNPRAPKNCNKKCNENTCQCADGFLRDLGGACVEETNCQPEASYMCNFNSLDFIERYSSKKGNDPIAPGKSRVFVCNDKKNNKNKKISLECNMESDGPAFTLTKSAELYFEHCGDGCSMDKITRKLGSTAQSSCDSSAPGSKCKFSCESSKNGDRKHSRKFYKCLCEDVDGKRVCNWEGKFAKDALFAAQKTNDNQNLKCVV